MVPGIVGHLVRTVFSARLDRIDDLVCLEIDHLDGTVAVTGPSLIPDYENSVWTSRIVVFVEADESGNPPNERPTLSVEDIDGFVASVSEVIPVCLLIDIADVERIQRSARHLNFRNHPEFSGADMVGQNTREQHAEQRQ